MSMLLTISHPAEAELGRRAPHDFSPRLSFTTHTSRFSPKPKFESSVTSLPASTSHKMSTPHRGLPPPAAMTLPDPSRPPAPLSQSQQLAAMPEPPRQWQGAEESMRNWLAAKAEEDKRKQEEERTRQESLRLEQRRIEQSMLRESLQGGVPPHTVPMIFAGIGGANLANVSLDWLQQYAAQLHAAQQQQQQQQQPQQGSPDLRRETRMINPPQPPYQQPQQPLPSAPVVASQPAPIQEHQSIFPVFQPAALNTSVQRPAPTSAPRSATHTSLPRLTTNDMHIPQPPQAGPGSAHPLQQSHTLLQDQPTSSPSIYFHHWVPPNESKSKDPSTPAGRSNEPLSAHPASHLSSGGDYRHSPRKRKAHDGHDANPPPSAGPSYNSPSFSTISSTSGRKGGHMRSRSNASIKDVDSTGRPISRRDSGPQLLSHQSNPERERSEERRQREPERESSLRAQQAPSDNDRREGSHHSESRDRRP